MHDPSERIGRSGFPEGLIAALVGAALLIGTFSAFTAGAPLAPAERWAALTTFALLAVALTLPGCSAIADALGRTIRRDWRAYATLLAAFPVLFLAYAGAVRAVHVADVLSAVLLVAVPGVLLWRSRGARQPTLLDAVGLGYLWLVGAFGLWPVLPLPLIGGRVDFFTLAVIPLIIIVFAARGRPGLGFTWHLSGADLRVALLGALIGLTLVLPTRLSGDFAAPGVLPLLGLAVESYFFVALPMAMLDRGIVQQSIMQALAARPQLAPAVSIVGGALVAGGRAFALQPVGWTAAMVAVTAIGYGWVYWRTGKVTAAAVSQMLVVWAG